MALPVVASVLALPFLVALVGTARFGAFALVLAVLAYVSLLDLGLGSAVTWKIATLLARPATQEEIALTVRTAAVAALAIGIAVGGVWFLYSPALAAAALAQEGQLVPEAAACLAALALATPAIYFGAVTSGLLAAYGEFGRLNVTRVPAGVLNYVLPVLAVRLWGDLATACYLLVVVRYAATFVQVAQCARLCPELVERERPVFSRMALGSLLGFGGWLTVSNTVGPLMVYMDRFYLATTRSAEQVTQYVTAHELASKLLLLPALVLPVYFPLLAASISRPREDAQSMQPIQLAAGMALASCIPSAVAAAFAPELIGVWMRGLVPSITTSAFQVLAGAVFVNCVAQVFYTMVQAAGRTALIARIHLLELPVYGAVLWYLTARHGVLGVAGAWALRVAVDSVVFCGFAAADLPRPMARRLWHLLGTSMLVGIVIAGFSQVPQAHLRAWVALLPLIFLAGWWRDLKSLFRAGAPRA
nr:oligosaccharide flippase family protein [Ramlibacter paludis]